MPKTLHAPILHGMALAAMAFAMPADAQQQRTAPNVTTPAIGAATLKNGQNKQVGNVAFVETPNRMLIQVRVDPGSGISPGMHGFHIHQNGSCETPDFQSAGGHFNPTGKEHGLLTPGGPHAGDLPNIWVDGDGAAQADILAGGLAFGGGANSLDKPGGTSVLIHATPDDYASNPSGNAGDRVACGVITRNVRR